jgi:hypothetical protein
VPHKDPEIARTYFQEYRQRNLDRLRAYDRERCKLPHRKELTNSLRRKSYHANPEKEADTRLRKLFGISLEDYRIMHDAQNGVCAICGKPETRQCGNGKPNGLAVDHDHITGKVRGLLCASCNTALGLLGDGPELLTVALAYLNAAPKPIPSRG